MLQLENVEFPKEKDTKGNEVVATMDTFLAPLIERLALAHPEWQFKAHYCRKYYGQSTGNAEFAKVIERVQVVDKYEALGELGYDYISKGKQFLVTNHRTEKMRERGSGMKTIHLDKACKHVEKYFGRMNHDEKIEHATTQATRIVWQAKNGATYPVNGAWNIVNDIAKDFVVDNLEKFKEFINQCDPTTVTVSRAIAEVEKLPELMAEMKGVNVIDEMWRGNKATLVLLDGMNYIVKHANQVEIKTSEELPDYVRRGVGMLKLVDNQHAISNIGIRVNDTTFVVIPNNVKE